MDPIQISVVIFMVAAAVAIIVWLQSSQADASAKRMMAMMTRVGLAPGTVTPGDPRITKEARRRCKGCPREDLCDRWLAGKIEGGNIFCPNAQTFQILTEASGQTS
jgi:hypothetical protein